MVALHAFMLPQVCPRNADLRNILATVQRWPSRLFAAGDTREGWLHYGKRMVSTGFEPESLSELFDGHDKGFRNADFLKAALPALNGPFAVDMEDARRIEPAVFFGCDLNVFQYHRRHGNRTAVLWPLPGFFEPTRRLGRVDGDALKDEVPFRDKLPRIVFRGEVSGSHWISPHRRIGALECRSLQEMRGCAPVFSRFRAVLEIGPRAAYTDFKFSGPRAAGNSALREGGFVDGRRTPAWLAQHRYVLCLNGNDVPSQLYWVIKTNSVAFKEDCDFESIPDYFLQPWVHYVPVAKGLTDLREKFEYCEANPALCERIVEQAQAAYWRMRDGRLWSEAMQTVLDRLRPSVH